MKEAQVSISEEYINHYSQYNIDHNTSQHYYQSLPCRFCSEFPGARTSPSSALIETFVHHTGYLYIASEWQPANSIFSFSF
ncbi:MAG: hypothetical protein R2771_11360 [Saprospiraceae bacterium]